MEQDVKKITNQMAFVGILGNVFLAVFKLIAGIVGHSTAMISDFVHTLSDVFATFIAYIGVVLSRKKADDKHPYGHERIECVASLILSFILFATGVLRSCQRFLRRISVFETASFNSEGGFICADGSKRRRCCC